MVKYYIQVVQYIDKVNIGDGDVNNRVKHKEDNKKQQ